MTAGVAVSHVLTQLGAAWALVVVAGTALPTRPRCRALSVAALLASGLLAFAIAAPRPGVRELVPFLILCAWPAIVRAWPRGQLSLRRWAWGFTGVATLAALAGGVRHFAGVERTYGFYGGYFTLAVLLAVALPIGCGLWATTRDRRASWWLAVALVVQLVALWWTGTRSAYLAFLVAHAIWWLTSVRRVPKRSLATLALPVLLLGFLARSSDSRLNPVRNAPNPREITEDLSSGRLGIMRDAAVQWSAAWHLGAVGRLLFGYGLESRGRLVGGAFKSWESDWLQALMDQGIFGVACLAWVYACGWPALAAGWRSAEPLPVSVAAAGIGCCLLGCMSLEVLAFERSALWILTTAALAGDGRLLSAPA